MDVSLVVLVILLLVCIGSVLSVAWCDRRYPPLSSSSDGSGEVESDILVYERPVVKVDINVGGRNWDEC